MLEQHFKFQHKHIYIITCNYIISVVNVNL